MLAAGGLASLVSWSPTAVQGEAYVSAVAEVPGLPTVTSASEQRLLDGVRYLASDELEGRGVGTNGLNLAADYVREEFKKAGLDVSRVEKDAFQKFTMVTGSELTSPNTLKFELAEGKTITLKQGVDFQTCAFGGSGAFSADLVFAGYGIDEKNPKYSDFDGVDVKGKVVIVMRRTPRQADPKAPFGGAHGTTSRQADLRSKVSNAVNKGVAAIVFVNDPYSVREVAKNRVEQQKKKAAKDAEKAAGTEKKEEKKDAAAPAGAANSGAVAAKDETPVEIQPGDDVLMAFGYGGRGNEQSLPIVHITQAALNNVLKEAGVPDLTSLEAEIDKDFTPQSRVLPVKAVGQTALKRTSVEVKNVIGVLEGSGPHADETIVIGAHLDHVGRGGEGSLAPGSKEIHNGADDNASGSSALLELARRLAARKEKLPRRLVFIAFTGEEMGLIGSARYVKEPIFPLDKTIAMFNMDMVGRLKDDQKLIVYGTGTSSRWTKPVEDLGKEYGFHIVKKPEGFGPSDHSSFYAKKIPVLHFFTGDHKDYHRPSDDWEKINVDGMARVVNMLEQIVLQTATNSERPDYIEVKTPVSQNRDTARPYFGSIPDFGSDTPGYAISGVAPGSPSEKGGLKGGDVIVELGKNKVTGLDDFDLALRKFKAGEEIDVVVLRKGEKVALKVTLAAPK